MANFHHQGSVLVGSYKFYFNYPKSLLTYVSDQDFKAIAFFRKHKKNSVGLLLIVGTKS